MNTIYQVIFKCRKCESEQRAMIPDTMPVKDVFAKLHKVEKTDCPVCGEEPYNNWLFVGVKQTYTK